MLFCDYDVLTTHISNVNVEYTYWRCLSSVSFSVIDQSKAAKAEEDFMTQQIQAVKFRSLAVGGNGRGGVSLKDMASYRQNLTSKKTKAAS